MNFYAEPLRKIGHTDCQPPLRRGLKYSYSSRVYIQTLELLEPDYCYIKLDTGKFGLSCKSSKRNIAMEKLLRAYNLRASNDPTG